MAGEPRILQTPPLGGDGPWEARCHWGLTSGTLRKPSLGQQKPNAGQLPIQELANPNPQLLLTFFGFQAASFRSLSRAKQQAIPASGSQN